MQQDERSEPDEPAPQRMSDKRFVQSCYITSTLCAYLGALAISFPVANLEIADTETLQSIIILLPLHLVMPQTVLFLPYVGLCVLVSMIWVHPISRWGRLSRGLRLLGVGSVGALASMGLYIYLALNFPMSRDHPNADNRACQRQMKQLGLTIFMYANDNEQGLYPELSKRPGTLAVRSDAEYPGIYPEYLLDLSTLKCPRVQRAHWWSKPPAPTSTEDDRSYFYLGYEIPDQQTLVYFAEAYRAQMAQGGNFENDLVLKREDGSSIIFKRLSDQSGRSVGGYNSGKENADTHASVPILIERYPNRHSLDGGNVVYEDGHVEHIAWGEKWPMTQAAMDILLALDAMGKDPAGS